MNETLKEKKVYLSYLREMVEGTAQLIQLEESHLAEFGRKLNVEQLIQRRQILEYLAQDLSKMKKEAKELETELLDLPSLAVSYGG